MDTGLLYIIILFLILGFCIFCSFVPLRLLIAARAVGVKLKMSSLAGMRLRKINQAQVVMQLLKAHTAGISITTEMLESHYLAGGNIEKVVDSLIIADSSNIPFDFNRAGAVDLAGGDPLDFIKHLADRNKAYASDEVAKAAAEYVRSLGKRPM